MKIHFLGATRTTTGSMYLVEVNGRRFLMECGLYQGQRDEAIPAQLLFPFRSALAGCRGAEPRAH
jgi:metallo-beta-lactamase family protein